MSPSNRSRTAALVCEGSSDVPLLSGIIQELWPEIKHVLTLRPEVDDMGRQQRRGRAGWSEVRAWCRANARLDDVIDPGIGERLDLIVVALDVDIAINAGIADPPMKSSAYDTKRLCDKVKQWLSTGQQRLPRELVIAIPAMSIEAWVLAANFKKPANPERIVNPARTLAKVKKLPVTSRGAIMKPLPIYEQFAKRVRGKLTAVRQRCPEADRFCAKVETVRDGAR